MTIDEAIAHEKEVAKEIYVEAMLCHANPDDGKLDDCIERGKYHEQLAECLEELKDYRDKNKMVVRVDVENMDSIKDKIDELSKYAEKQYNKAIDDLRNELKNHYTEYNIDCVLADTNFYSYTTACNYLEDYIDEIAEQLKAGGNIELSEHS